MSKRFLTKTSAASIFASLQFPLKHKKYEPDFILEYILIYIYTVEWGELGHWCELGKKFSELSFCGWS